MAKFVVKYQDIGEKVTVSKETNSEDEAISHAKSLSKKDRWVIVFKGKQLHWSERL